MKTFLSFAIGVCVGACGIAAGILGAVGNDENFAKGFLMMAGYNFKTPSETKKEYEAK